MNQNIYSIINTTIDKNTFNFIKNKPLKDKKIIDIIIDILEIFIIIIII
jgi:hypothetical protein